MEDGTDLAPPPVPALLPACVALVAGGCAPAAATPLVLVVAAVVLGGCGIAVVAVRGEHRRTVRRLAASALLAVAVGGGAAVRLHQLTTSSLAEVGARSGSASVVVEVVGEPVGLPSDRWRGDVRVVAVDGVPTRVRAELRSEARVRYGATLTGIVEVRPATAAWRRARHVAAVLHGDLEEVAPPGRAVAATTAVRDRLASVAAGALPPGRAGLATGLVTGDTSLLPEVDDEAMRDVGLTHLTAVSGSNVALVAAGIGGLAALVGVGARGRRRAVVVALAAFLVLTRADPSVLRATAMAGVVLLAQATGRRISGAQALAAGLLVLVVLDPLLSRRLGLLLSAAATAGVLLLAPRIAARARRWTGGGVRGRVGDLVAVTLGAQVAVLPVLLAIGEDVRLATVPANLVAVPAAAVASVLCTAAAVVALPAPWLAAALLRLAEPALGVVLGAAHRLRWWGPELGAGDGVALVAVTAAVAWAVAPRGGPVARRLGGVTVAAGCLLAASVGGIDRQVDPATDGSFVLTAIDVGQGDSFLLRAGSAAVLVDTGRDDRAARWLHRSGVDRVDLLVLTHADEDHSGGAVDVLRTVDVGALWQRPRSDAAPSALAAALQQARDGGLPIASPAAGAGSTVGPLVVRVLAPPDAGVHAGLDAEENESSLVLRVDGPGGSVLLTGDTGPAAHATLLADPPLLDVDVVTVPHHGSADVDLGLVPATTPHTAVVSVGGDNRYGHPTAEAVTAVTRAGAVLRRTDREGTVHVEVAPAPVARAARAGRLGPHRPVGVHRARDRSDQGAPRRRGRHDPRGDGRRPVPLDGGPRRPGARGLGRRGGRRGRGDARGPPRP